MCYPPSKRLCTTLYMKDLMVNRMDFVANISMIRNILMMNLHLNNQAMIDKILYFLENMMVKIHRVPLMSFVLMFNLSQSMINQQDLRTLSSLWTMKGRENGKYAFYTRWYHVTFSTVIVIFSLFIPFHGWRQSRPSIYRKLTNCFFYRCHMLQYLNILSFSD